MITTCSWVWPSCWHRRWYNMLISRSVLSLASWNSLASRPSKLLHYLSYKHNLTPFLDVIWVLLNRRNCSPPLKNVISHVSTGKVCPLPGTIFLYRYHGSGKAPQNISEIWVLGSKIIKPLDNAWCRQLVWLRNRWGMRSWEHGTLVSYWTSASNLCQTETPCLALTGPRSQLITMSAANNTNIHGNVTRKSNLPSHLVAEQRPNLPLS